MGAGVSAQHAAVSSVLHELRGLEASIRSIEAVQRREVVALTQQLARRSDAPVLSTSVSLPITQSGDEIYQNGCRLVTGSAKVLVGPVVGLVAQTTARILLEVDSDSDVTLHLALISQAAPEGLEICTIMLPMTSRKPSVFEIEGLTVSSSYRYAFSGLSATHTMAACGSFRTLNDHGSIRILCVSGNIPCELQPNEHDPWGLVESRVSNETVDLMLHLGDQVDSKHVFEECSLLLQRHEARPRLSDAARAAVEAEVEERLRKPYRFAWNLPRVRSTLANCPSLMIRSGRDLYPEFNFAKNANGSALSPTLLRIAQQVSRDYQRALWDASSATEMVWGKDGSGNEEQHFHRIGGLGILFLDTRGAFLLPDGTQLPDAPFISETQWAFVEQSLASDGMHQLIVASDRPFVDYAPEVARKLARDPEREWIREHWSFHAHDQARLLKLLFTWQNSPPSASALGPRQVCLLAGGSRVGVDTQISLVAGPARISSDNNNTTNMQIRQLVVGPVTASVAPFKPAGSGKIHDRGDIEGTNVESPTTYTFAHVPLLDQRSFACIDVVFSETEAGTSGLSAQLIGLNAELGSSEAIATLGPVIGKVTSTTAVVLLETSRTVRVTCILTDTISHSQHRRTVLMPAMRPVTFSFESLEPERRYIVEFHGILKSAARKGLVTTMPPDDAIGDQPITIVAIGADRASELSPHKPNAWKDLTQLVGPLWGGPHMVLHLGGQISLRESMPKVREIIRRRGALSIVPEALPLPVLEAVLGEITEVFRDAYRLAWNLPFTRETLARSSNLMMWSNGDIGDLLGRGPFGLVDLEEPEVRWRPLLVQISRQLYREYQRQLWDLNLSATDVSIGGLGVQEQHFHRWGKLGVVFLDMLGNSVNVEGSRIKNRALLSAHQWSDLETFLREDLSIQALVLVSETPVLDDSPTDAKRKAMHPLRAYLKNRWPHNFEECRHLLELLFAWKASDPGREMIIVAASDLAVSTIIFDAQQGLTKPSDQSKQFEDMKPSKLQQLCVTPITGNVANKFESEVEGHVEMDQNGYTRFSYKHAPVGGACNVFGAIRIEARKVGNGASVEEDASSTTSNTDKQSIVRIHADLIAHEHAKTQMDRMSTLPAWITNTLADAEKAQIAKEKARLINEERLAKQAELEKLEKEMEEAQIKEIEEEDKSDNKDNEESTLTSRAKSSEKISTVSEEQSGDTNPSLRGIDNTNESCDKDDINEADSGKALDSVSNVLDAAFESEAFQKGLAACYARYSTESVGIEVEDFLLFISNFYFRESTPEANSVFPLPDDKLSSSTLLSLLVRYILEEREEKARRTGGTREAPVGLVEATSLVRGVFEKIAALRAVLKRRNIS